jgi:hypothetical protein
VGQAKQLTLLKPGKGNLVVSFSKYTRMIKGERITSISLWLCIRTIWKADLVHRRRTILRLKLKAAELATEAKEVLD